MSNSWKTASDAELERDAEIPDALGGSAERRAGAKAEIKRREREGAEKLAEKQFAIAEKQAATARSAVWAAWGSAVAAFLACAISVWQLYHKP